MKIEWKLNLVVGSNPGSVKSKIFIKFIFSHSNNWILVSKLEICVCELEFMFRNLKIRFVKLKVNSDIIHLLTTSHHLGLAFKSFFKIKTFKILLLGLRPSPALAPFRDVENQNAENRNVEKYWYFFLIFFYESSGIRTCVVILEWPFLGRNLN